MIFKFQMLWKGRSGLCIDRFVVMLMSRNWLIALIKNYSPSPRDRNNIFRFYPLNVPFLSSDCSIGNDSYTINDAYILHVHFQLYLYVLMKLCHFTKKKWNKEQGALLSYWALFNIYSFLSITYTPELNSL